MGQGNSSDLYDDEDADRQDNLLFYQNKIRSRPWPGKKIEKMLRWHGDYSTLEVNHSYIQWLFPLSEGSGVNWSAQRLFEHEAKAIRADEETRYRVLLAYEMMLDFYGFRLVNEIDGTVTRTEHTWQDRLKHLNRSKHNFRRITRILKSLAELGFEHYQSAFVSALMEEAIVHRTIPAATSSALQFWIEAIHDDQERDEMRRRYQELTSDASDTGKLRVTDMGKKEACEHGSSMCESVPSRYTTGAYGVSGDATQVMVTCHQKEHRTTGKGQKPLQTETSERQTNNTSDKLSLNLDRLYLDSNGYGLDVKKSNLEMPYMGKSDIESHRDPVGSGRREGCDSNKTGLDSGKTYQDSYTSNPRPDISAKTSNFANHMDSGKTNQDLYTSNPRSGSSAKTSNSEKYIEKHHLGPDMHVSHVPGTYNDWVVVEEPKSHLGEADHPKTNKANLEF